MPNEIITIRKGQLSFLSAAAVLTALLSTGCASRGEALPERGRVIVPTEPIQLFNGRNLSSFYTWLPEHGYEDPNQVFRVVDQIDGAPALRISGEDWGGLITKERYANYHLIAEYRWGPVTWGERSNKARDAGILLHAQGPEGNYKADFRSPWMRSIEYQIIEGGTGDALLLGGYDSDGTLVPSSLTTTVRLDRDGETVWDPEGEPQIRSRGRVNWYGRDPDWADTLNFRGKEDLEKPVGQWNRIDAYAHGDSLTYLVNGRVVLKGTGADPSEGKLLFQSEGAEIYFRRIELHPLP